MPLRSDLLRLSGRAALVPGKRKSGYGCSDSLQRLSLLRLADPVRLSVSSTGSPSSSSAMALSSSTSLDLYKSPTSSAAAAPVSNTHYYKQGKSSQPYTNGHISTFDVALVSSISINQFEELSFHKDFEWMSWE